MGKMNKKWEEELKIVILEVLMKAKPPVKGYPISQLEIKLIAFIAKQRTQLLARVREEIEKSRKKIPNEFYSFRPKYHMTNEEYEKYQYDEGFNLSVEEQLKKLEIISEEVKE